jgi:hypothetical protein
MIVELVVNPFVTFLEFIGMIDADLEKELEQFEKTFERNEIVDL